MLLFTAYLYTPIKSSFEDAGSVEDMMRCSKLPCRDLTLSVGKPDNAAAKQGQELRSEQTVINIHEQRNSLLIFLRLNNSETFVENAF